jgi:hypothetical protein
MRTTCSDLCDEFLESEGLRTDGIDDGVFRSVRLLDSECSKIVDVDRLEPIRAITEDTECWETTQGPGDVIDQDVLLTEENCGSQDRIGEAGLDQRSLQVCLALEVGQFAVERGVGDADVDYSRHAGVFGGAEERESVVDGLGVREITVVETYPVGVDQHSRSCQRSDELLWSIEVERRRGNATLERVLTVRGASNSMDCVALIDEPSSDVLPGITESTRDDELPHLASGGLAL